ncbi:uncharacterized protein LOC123468106 [Daphnia magna]|uniref:uncharacterized protein LOC123468106 n=1 Tax=Daphnia magna TaxID=35525 RepID=UPI001E1BAEEB|nr:uncharacterized protein LOC123468106 [Daphnia magna]
MSRRSYKWTGTVSQSDRNTQAGWNPPGPKYYAYCKTNTHLTAMCSWGPGGPRCFKCKQNGHVQRECPDSQPKHRIGNQIKNFSTDAPVELFGVDNTRLRTRGTVTLEMNVLGDDLLQEFIVVDRIDEDCILGLDALYEHKFIIDGSERTIYRVKETKEDTASAPAIITKNRITIKLFSATVVESDGEGGKLPQNITCYLERGPGVHSGLRVDPFVCSVNDLTVFSVVLINETNELITVPKFQVIGRIVFERTKKKTSIFVRQKNNLLSM